MAARGSGTVESPITLSDSPPRSSGRQRDARVGIYSPVKVLEGDEFRNIADTFESLSDPETDSDSETDAQSLATMPKGRGRKGCAPPPRKKKKVAAKPRKTFAQLLKEHCSASSGVDKEGGQSDASGDGSSEDMLTQAPVTCGGAALELNPTGSRVQSGEVTRAASDQYGMCEYNVSLQGGGIEFSHSKSGTKLNVSGGQQESRSTSGLPLVPPPLVHCPTSPTSPQLQSPLELAFISGNIPVCRGCKQKYTKPASAPLDLCIRHKEWQEYLGPLGTPQTRYGNVYCHCNIPCIRSRNPDFEPTMLSVHPSITMQLMPIHTEYLSSHMPGRF